MATPTKDTSAANGAGWSNEEKAAAREHTRELKAQAKRGADRDADEKDCLAKIAEMPKPDRILAESIHAIVAANAPELHSKTWYGMPAYARDGKIVCFFKSADKFKSRYATFGFEENALLDEGTMWPTSYALTTMTKADETKIAEMVKKAAG